MEVELPSFWFPLQAFTSRAKARFHSHSTREKGKMARCRGRPRWFWSHHLNSLRHFTTSHVSSSSRYPPDLTSSDHHVTSSESVVPSWYTALCPPASCRLQSCWLHVPWNSRSSHQDFPTQVTRESCHLPLNYP